MSENLSQTIERTSSVDFTAQQLDIIKTVLCPGLTDNELHLFAAVCKRTGLDPFARQIHAVKRYNAELGREALTIQTGIDGFRIIADRTGKYAGQLGPHWTADGKNWVDVWISDVPPVAARVGVVRSNFTEPLWATARFAAYAQKKKDGELFSNWKKMGDVMIAKCAEALALRRAFPNELSGIYADEEMMQADGEHDPKDTKLTATNGGIKPPQQKATTPPQEPKPEPEKNGNGGNGTGIPQYDGMDSGKIQTFWDVSGNKPATVKLNETRYSTFDTKLADTAKAAKHQDVAIDLYYKENIGQKDGKVYRNIVYITLAESEMVEAKREPVNDNVPF